MNSRSSSKKEAEELAVAQLLADEAVKNLEENPPIASEEVDRIANAIEYHLGHRRWDKKKAYTKAGIGRKRFEKWVAFLIL